MRTNNMMEDCFEVIGAPPHYTFSCVILFFLNQINHPSQ